MRISIVCPVHDTPPPLLAAAARSVLHDPSGAIRQFILVDDGSRREDTKRTLVEIAATDPRVTLIRAPRAAGAVGPASARNLALAAAREDWVGFLDSDDTWLPGHPARLRGLLAAHPEAVWIGTRHRLVSADGASESARGLDGAGGHRLADNLLRFEAPALTRVLLSDFRLHLGASLVRRDLAEAAGGFGEGLFYYEDFLFLTKLSTLAPLHYLEADGYGWRRGGDGLTSDARRLDPSTLAMHARAARDPMLQPFRREIRWARYSATKGLAMNNLLAGRRRQALALAIRGWLQDPREMAELLLFLRLWRRGVEAEAAARYSGAERFVVRCW
jgi:glycosyltransferase involved in cell wall biosynthesis